MVLVCDRSRASQGLAQDDDDRLVAFCGAHGRREVRKAARRWPELARGMGTGVEESRARSRLTTARLEV